MGRRTKPLSDPGPPAKRSGNMNASVSAEATDKHSPKEGAMSIGRNSTSAAEIAKALGGRRHAGYWTAKCPAHDDRALPSVSATATTASLWFTVSADATTRSYRRTSRPRPVAGSWRSPGMATVATKVPEGKDRHQRTSGSEIWRREPRSARHHCRAISRLTRTDPSRGVATTASSGFIPPVRSGRGGACRA